MTHIQEYVVMKLRQGAKVQAVLPGHCPIDFVEKLVSVWCLLRLSTRENTENQRD